MKLFSHLFAQRRKMHLQKVCEQIPKLRCGDCILFDIKNRKICFLHNENIFFMIALENQEEQTDIPWLHFYQAQSFMHIISLFCGYQFTEYLRTDTTVQYRLLPQKRKQQKQAQ